MESDSKPSWRVEEGGARNVSGQGRAGLRDAPECHSQALACCLPTGYECVHAWGDARWKASESPVIPR